MSSFNLKSAVIDLLFLEVDAILEGDRPDATMDFDSRYAVRDYRERAMVEQWWREALDHEQRRTQLARALYRRYAKAAMRFDLSLLPDDLRQWANRWLREAKKAAADPKRLDGAVRARVFVYLTVRDAVAWERDQSEAVTLDSLVTESFGDGREDGEYDGGPLDIEPTPDRSEYEQSVTMWSWRIESVA